MALTDQEARCVELACQYLDETYSGSWVVQEGPTLEELHRNDPVPEVLVTNGSLTAAIEVKRVADKALTDHTGYTYSLKNYLAPACGGYYYLAPSTDIRLPLTDAVRRYLKHEITNVAPQLSLGEKGIVQVPQAAMLTLVNSEGPGLVFCCHGTGDSVRQFSTRLSAQFYLADCDCWSHSFVTEEGREAFATALLAAARMRLVGEPSRMSWLEEWELFRSDDTNNGNGVWFMSVTEAHSVPDAVTAAVDSMLSKSLRKFTRRWADLHVLVLDRATSIVSSDLVEGAIPNAEPSELALVDVILFTDKSQVRKVWPTSR
jgi:hypothetical protein